jgi:hypothetical protein
MKGGSPASKAIMKLFKNTNRPLKSKAGFPICKDKLVLGLSKVSSGGKRRKSRKHRKTRKSRRGGSPASKNVMKLFKNTNRSLQPKAGFPICKDKLVLGLSKVSSGGKRRKSRNGGSPLSYMMNQIYKKKVTCKRGPGKFPKRNKNNLMKLSPPIYRNGVLLVGGSDWKSTVYSVKSPLSKRSKKLGKRFTKTEIYKQIAKKIHKGTMFKPF